MNSRRLAPACLASFVLVVSGCAVTMPQPDERDRAFVAAVAEPDDAKRGAALETVDAGPGAIALLAEPLLSADRAVVHRARRALIDLAHRSSRPGARRARREATLAIETLVDRQPPLAPAERQLACRLLGLVMVDDAAMDRMTARSEDPELRDAAAYALILCGRSTPSTMPPVTSGESKHPERACQILWESARQDGSAADLALVSGLRMSDTEVRMMAADLLIERDSDDLDAALARELGTAPPDERAVVYRVLEGRGALSDSLLEVALCDPDESAWLAAIDVLGARTDDASEKRLGDLVLDPHAGAMRAREAVLAALTRHAERHAFAGEKDAAARTARLVLSSSKEDATRAEALKVFAALADPDTLPIVDAAGADAGPLTRAALVRARLAIADGIRARDPAAATAAYRAILGQPENRRAREAALRRLTAAGVDARDVIAKTGVILDWHVLGPLSRDAMPFEEQPFGAVIDTSAESKIGDAMVRWTPLSTSDLDGHVDLLAQFDGRHDAIAFAAATISMEDACDATLEIGSDDGVAVWLNGERLLAHDVPRGWSPGEEKVAARFAKGENLLLLKVTQGGGDWGLSARVARAVEPGGR